jgi:hypothetical protein
MRIASKIEGSALIAALKEAKPTQGMLCCIPGENGAKSTHNLIAETGIGSVSKTTATQSLMTK